MQNSNTRKVILKKAIEKDFPDLFDLYQDCFQRSSGEAWSKISLKNTLVQPTSHVILFYTEEGDAEEKIQKPEGFSILQVLGDEVELLSFGVKYNRQKKGLGKIFLEKTISYCRDLEGSKFFLEVDENNKSAICVYEYAGLKITGNRIGYYKYAGGFRSDAFLMTLHLY